MSRAGFAACPFHSMRPSSHARAASERVLKKRAAHSHLSILKAFSWNRTGGKNSLSARWSGRARQGSCGRKFLLFAVLALVGSACARRAQEELLTIRQGDIAAV